MKRRDYILMSVILVGTLQTLCSAGPCFWVRCSSCETSQTNAFQTTRSSTDDTLFSCGTGMFPGTFRVLVQCQKCHRLGALNLLQPEYDAAVEAKKTGGSPPDYAKLRQRLTEVAAGYHARTVEPTDICPSCGGPLKIVYFPWNELPESGDPEDVTLPLSVQCPTCGSNTLEAVSAGFHFD